MAKTKREYGWRERGVRSFLNPRKHLTEAEYAAMLEAQDSACAICRKPDDPSSKVGKGSRHRLVLDHDHSTGIPRGILCHECNIMLGLSRDSSAFLRLAAEYLDAHQARNQLGASALGNQP